jgi:hypothetical protein
MANIDADMLASSLRPLGGAAGRDIVGAVDEVVHACAELFGVNGCGLMIADEQNSLHYVAASDGPSHVLEEVQSESGQGPCVEAFVVNDIVTTEDLGSDPRWPLISGTLVDHGVTAVLGCPLRLGGDVVEATLGAAMAAHRAGKLAGQLQYALDYRIVIERAVGYLMAQRGLDSVAAFNLLRRAARDHRRKVAEVAEDLLRSGGLPGRG